MLVLGLVLAWLFGLAPWRGMHASASSLLLAALATVPLVAGLLALPSGRWQWADELTALVRRFLRVLFRHAWPGAIVVVSVLAGVGEELLFRGVIQAGLADLTTPAVGLIVASCLFGAAHAVSLSYWLLATLMGLYLGLLYQWTDNLLVPILVHALYDWVAIRFYLRREFMQYPG